MSKFEACTEEVSLALKRKGFNDPEKLASKLCSFWADENGVERNFARQGSRTEKQRTFALNFGELSIAEDYVEIPVTALTSGLHTYVEDGNDQKVYIEPSIIKDSISNFNDLPIYYTHQRTPEDLIGTAVNPEVFETEDGKTAIKMLAKIDKNANERALEVLDKVKSGDITHVSIDWLSNDVDVMGEPFATNIRPAELSFIDNEIATPVCEACTIDGPCEVHEGNEEETCNCKDGTKCECEHSNEDISMTEEQIVQKVSNAESIVEREFASVKNELVELKTVHEQLNSKYTEAIATIANFEKDVEVRATAEAKARKGAFISKIVAKELILNALTEDEKEARAKELSAWEEIKLDGFSSALETVSEPENTERTFGKGKARDAEEAPVEGEEETTRLFAMKDGKITLNKEALKGD